MSENQLPRMFWISEASNRVTGPYQFLCREVNPLSPFNPPVITSPWIRKPYFKAIEFSAYSDLAAKYSKVVVALEAHVKGILEPKVAEDLLKEIGWMK